MSRIIVFQGDSITDCGHLAPGKSGYPSTYWGPGYPGLIGAKLTGEQPEREWKIYNRGVSGNCIVDLCARWKKDCIQLTPNIVSILIGINDTGREHEDGCGVEVSVYERCYRLLLDWTLAWNPQVKFVLMEPFMLPFGLATSAWQEEIEQRGTIVRNLALQYQDCAVFVPLQEVFREACKRADQTYWLVDGVHAQPAGHHLIMQAWLEAAGGLL